jgi:hypothetical protein
MPRSLREPRPFAALALLLLAVAIAAGCAGAPQESANNTSVNHTGVFPNSTNTTSSQPTLPGFNTTAGSGETPVIAPGP